MAKPLWTRNTRPQTPKPNTQHPKSETRNPQSATRNPKPDTRNSKPETRNPQPDPHLKHGKGALEEAVEVPVLIRGIGKELYADRCVDERHEPEEHERVAHGDDRLGERCHRVVPSAACLVLNSRLDKSANDPKPETRNPKPETRNSKPETQNPKPETRNLKPETRNPKPRTHAD